MELINMKLPASSAPTTGLPTEPRAEYPYGLQLSLSDEVLKKLGVEYLPAVGSYYMIVAHCCVTSISESQREGEEKQKRLELQIEEMALSEPVREVDATALYPNSKMES